MAKTPRRSPVVAAKSLPVALPLFSALGKRLMAGGFGLVIICFFVLTFTDPAGRNWASHLAPLLLVLGYVLIGFGIARNPLQ